MNDYGWQEITMGEYNTLLRDARSYATVRCTLGPDIDIWEKWVEQG